MKKISRGKKDAMIKASFFTAVVAISVSQIASGYSWWSLVLLALAGFFLGGVISFARARRVPLAIAMGVAALLCVVGAVAWWNPA